MPLPAALVWPTVCLSPLAEGDAAHLNEWQNDPSLRDLTMGFRGPVTEATTLAWLRKLAEPGSSAGFGLPARFVFGVRQQARLVGTVQLHSIDWLHRHAMLGVTIGARESRGQGIGFAASALLLDYAFGGLDLQRVALSVLASNGAARRLYDRLGFVSEGTLRSAYLADGKRHDVTLYGLLRSEWRSPVPETAARLVHRLGDGSD